VTAYTPTTWPGARPPSLYLADGRAIFDLFGNGFTLLRFADIDTEALTDAARRRGVPLEVIDLRDEHARRLYERDLVLIRPDQHVAWRGNTAPGAPERLIDLVRGDASVNADRLPGAAVELDRNMWRTPSPRRATRWCAIRSCSVIAEIWQYFGAIGTQCRASVGA
jgi:hypothetical protein